MNQSLETDVLIIGGGVAGGGTACAFGTKGKQVVLVEKKRSGGDLNRGEILHKSAQQHLEDWGALPAFKEAVGVTMEKYRIRHHILGLISEFDQLGDLVVPHPTIERLLAEHAQKAFGARVLRGWTANKLIQEHGRVVGAKFISGKDGELTVKAKLTIGADGMKSVTRRELGIEADTHTYSYEFCYFEAARMPDTIGNEHYLNPHGFLMRRPVSKDRMRVVFQVPRKQGHRYVKMSQEELAQDLGKRWSVFKNWPIDAEGRHVYAIARQQSHEYQRPGVALVGDAAHVTHPATGQGMHIALDGAQTLVDLTSPALDDPNHLDQALKEYENQRRSIADNVLKRTHEVATFVVEPGLWAYLHRLFILSLYRILPIRRMPLLAIPSFTVMGLIRTMLAKRREQVGVYAQPKR